MSATLSNASAPNIVVIEDDAQIRHFIHTALSTEGWQIFAAGTLKQGLIEAGTRRPDLVILDLGLPDGNGIDFLREFRGWSSTPVIVLSARTDEAEKVKALDAGADDYLTKPFGVAELLARIRANLRRNLHKQDAESAFFSFGGNTLDFSRRVVTRNKAEVHLTPIEYRLLAILATHPGRVITQRQLLQEVWGPAHSERTHYLRIHMGHLRQKLEDDPAQPKHILTETAVGYRLQP
ncbi:MAG: two-component system response regulator KdpE [Cellvibrionales bacterium]|jgi:two-component system KDP operon response regulator KdpE|nr:two-component system response regulator KdpE [Cellvibrionales bacterium]